MTSVPFGDLGFFGGFRSVLGFGFRLDSLSSSVVLDREGSEVVRAPSRLGGKRDGGGVLDAKAATALKNHSEAERRRRERINGHLAVLRRMIPGAGKLDKAALLAQVINHVKKLKMNAEESSKGHTIPSDLDEVSVEVERDYTDTSSFTIKATLCCEDRPEILADLRQALKNLSLRTLSAEVSTLDGRMKNVLLLTSEGNTGTVDTHRFVASVHQALKSVVDRVNAQADLPSISFPNKRRRISLFEPSSSSS